MRPPLVSVLLPCRDAEPTLPAALDSLSAQTFRDFEAIIIDDGSVDGSAEIAARHCLRDSRFRLDQHPHRGIVAALQSAAAESRGAFLARMDADDVAAPTRLERQLDYLRALPEVGLCGTRVESFGEGIGRGRKRYDAWVNSVVTPEHFERELFIECPVPHPTFFMRREAFDSAGGYVDRGWPEDYDLVLRLWNAGWKVGKVDEILLRWRHSRGRLQMADPRYSPEQFRAVKRHHLEQTYLMNGPPFFQWGAGEVGKHWLREWGRRLPRAVVDIHPRKIGRKIHGVHVIAPDDLPAPGDGFTVVAVGARGAHDEIRAWFGVRNYAELRDYLFVA